MGLKTGELIQFKVKFKNNAGPLTGYTINVHIYDELNNLSSDTATEIGNGWYYYDLTPDNAGCWGISLYDTIGGVYYSSDHTFWVEKGQEEDIEADTTYITDTAIVASPTAGTMADHLQAQDGGDLTHDITTTNDTVETDLFELSNTNIYALTVKFDLDVLETAGEGGTITFRLYEKINGSSYPTNNPNVIFQYVVGTSDEYPSIETDLIHGNSKLTIQCSGDVTTTRQINYRRIYRPIGV